MALKSGFFSCQSVRFAAQGNSLAETSIPPIRMIPSDCTGPYIRLIRGIITIAPPQPVKPCIKPPVNPIPMAAKRSMVKTVWINSSNGCLLLIRISDSNITANPANINVQNTRRSSFCLVSTEIYNNNFPLG